MADPTGEVTDLLQHLIRNACVNDGTPDSGQERRSADLLQTYLEGPGLDLQRYEPRAGRASLVGRIEGSDPEAPSLLLMGHTDVVPANAHHWRHDPFGGELIEGEVWGRGAVDMLNLTASMAVATRHLARSGFRPRGDLVYLAVADEEALGIHGAAWLTEHERDAVTADYLLTESGGYLLNSPAGPKVPVTVAEKGAYWCRLRVHGTAGHASKPLRTDNALVKAAEVVRRLAAYRPPTRLHDTWKAFVRAMEFPPDVAEAFLTEEGFVDRCEALPSIGLARQAHACTHTTFAPTIIKGGTKINVIPDRVDLEIDIRTLPAQTGAEVQHMLRDAVGELVDSVEIVSENDDPSTSSPHDTPLWDTIQRAVAGLHPGAVPVPYMATGATDARFFRRLGTVCYGFGLFSPRMDIDRYLSMFHGDDERVDQESLRLSTELWQAVARDLLVG